jgi:hypothetical protein
MSGFAEKLRRFKRAERIEQKLDVHLLFVDALKHLKPPETEEEKRAEEELLRQISASELRDMLAEGSWCREALQCLRPEETERRPKQ